MGWSGAFSGSFNATQAGVWTVVAHYAGNTHYAPSDSDPFYVSVQNPPP